MKVQSIGHNSVRAQNNNYQYYGQTAFTSNSGVVYEGDYVKIPKEKYERDKFWKRVDYVALAGFLVYCLYQIFKKGGQPPSI